MILTLDIARDHETQTETLNIRNKIRNPSEGREWLPEAVKACQTMAAPLIP